MKKSDAQKIIKEEQLVSYNLLEDRKDASDEIVIRHSSGQWIVYATDERASKIVSGEAAYATQEEALDHFIRRLRALNRVINSQ